MHAIPEPSGKRFGRLQTLGIHVPEQILLHLPKDYLDMTHVEEQVMESHCDGLYRIYRVVVSTKPSFASSVGQTPRISFMVTDGHTPVRITVFGAVFEWKFLSVADVIFVRAKVRIWNGELQLESPELVKAQAVGKIVPVYRGKKGVVAAETFAEYAQEALQNHIEGTSEYIRRSFDGFDEDYLFRQAGVTGYQSIAEIILQIHAPETLEQAKNAIHAARKLAAFEIVKESRKRKQKKPEARSAIMIKPDEWREVAKSIPYEPTDDQKQAITEIVKDLSSPYTMSRLLNGDVGTGKSYVIGITAMLANQAGAKVAILTPNLLLVDQLYDEFSQWWPKQSFVKALGTTKSLPLIDNPIVIGTVALLNRLERHKWTPDYLIVDEQERFSIKQREQLAKVHTNMLESTATCIPRTAAMITHGGMDISILTQSPVKKKIQTRFVGINERARLFEHVTKMIESGGQVAIIYPQVSGQDEKKSAIEAFSVWERTFPGKAICVHGKMSSDEKQDAIQKIKDGHYSLIVSTTILERGVTIPKLRTGIVVNPERYGVTQLHQLRGRLVRKGGLGYFFLYAPDSIDEDAHARINLLVDIEEGHKLAEMDMEMRGFGDLSDDADDQHGLSRSGLFQGIKMRPSDIRAAMEI
jgi:ATP-dependent DNA helicase RecG